MRKQFDIARLRQDFVRYCAGSESMGRPGMWTFIRTFLFKPEFRSVVYYRIGHASLLVSWLFRPQQCLFLNCSSIGGGLVIQHGFATIVSAKRIGQNFHLHQQVTIGWNGDGNPVIGDDVSVNSGAIVIGNIHIGDDVEIGAGAVVTSDVPSHSMVVGVPARIIKVRPSKDEPWTRIDPAGKPVA